MPKNYLIKIVVLLFGCTLVFFSCKKIFEAESYVAYFGGEIINPQNDEIIFLKNGKAIDTFKLDKNNRFFHKFDSLTPGLYSFQHLPEFQYIYFDKNDSLMIRLNANDFDNSLAFCGRGDEKNNYLIDQFLLADNDRELFFNIVDSDFISFTKSNDSLYNVRKENYLQQKEELNWSESFDLFAKLGIDFSYYQKKELYPVIHELKESDSIFKKLPADYFDYRKNIDFNNVALIDYKPFVQLVTTMINNIAFRKNDYKIDNISVANNIYKLNLADSLIKNETVKNTILNNIAYMFLIENQNMYNNKKFIDRYLELSTDKQKQKEVTEIFEAVKALKIGNTLPQIDLIDTNSGSVDLKTITNNKETVIYFWSIDAKSHMKSVHEKVQKLQEKYPTTQFIGVNLDTSTETWKNTIKTYNLNNFNELKATSFEDIRKKWVITRVHRIIILNADGSIKNGFANIYKADFEKELK